jgi:hypothetical protein
MVARATSRLLALSYEAVVNRVRTGEWNLEKFTEWADTKADYTWAEGYEEGYDTADGLGGEVSEAGDLSMNHTVN